MYLFGSARRIWRRPIARSGHRIWLQGKSIVIGNLDASQTVKQYEEALTKPPFHLNKMAAFRGLSALLSQTLVGHASVTNKVLSPMTRIIAISVVRNEADIVAQALRHVAPYLDLCIVVDCGSTDGTAREVSLVKRDFAHVFLVKNVGPLFPDIVRRHVWNAWRRHFSWKDWWLYADADEFVDRDPRDAVREAVNERADHIFSAHANFYYTQSEASAWKNGVETELDRQRPIGDRRRHYRMHTSQIRLFRNLFWLRWNSDTFTPTGLAKPASMHLPIRHYQYRDLSQIYDRWKIRNSHMVDGAFRTENPHWYGELEESISKDGDPSLQTVSSECSLVPDPALPVIPHQSKLKTVLKYCRSIAKSLVTRDGKPELFSKGDVTNSVLQLKKL